MIDTALQIASKGAVEHAKDVAQETLGELSERLKDVELPRLPLAKPEQRQSHRGRWILLLLGALGVGVVVVMARRRMSQRMEIDDVAPDAFGAAVEEERASGGFGQRPIATPGA